MIPRIALTSMLFSLLPLLSACNKQGHAGASPFSNGDSAKQGDQADNSPEKAKGYQLLGELDAHKSTRGLLAMDIDLARRDYERAKGKLQTAASGADLEFAKLEASDKRDQLAKAQSDYDNMLAADKNKLEEAKRLIGAEYSEDDGEILKDISYDPQTGRQR